ncbi:MAG: efflux RND transporter permease subunit, partial [Bacteroidetes bacterium]|nr:efflux RND transporter permease subunit [Bacteroidota bacterium]
TITRGSAPTEINHLNINRVTDIYANVEDRDIGSVSAEIKAIIDQMEDRIPDGYEVRIRGEIENMQKSFSNLGLGLVLAVILAFLVIVPLFRSFKLPLIIILTVPLGLIGVVWMLFLTNTNINIQSLMGVIMMIGIAVSFGNLLVDRINRLVQEGKSVDEAIMEGAASRFRPIIMVMLANVFALLPMSLGLETGGEANIPLARAILGGVTVSALLALFIIPVLYRLFTTQKTNYEEVQENIPN